MLIYPCRLHCSTNATCRFRLDKVDEIVAYCACPNGQAVGELQDCIFGKNANFLLKKVLTKSYSLNVKKWKIKCFILQSIRGNSS